MTVVKANAGRALIGTGNRNMRFICVIACFTLLAACAGTVQKKDWQTKIGHYTLDEARLELGSPESCVGLDDGGTACSWTTSKDKEAIDKLVLTFGPHGKLSTANHIRF